MKTTGFKAILLILTAAAFGYGLVKLFYLRFEAGDIYPRYSSLRSDPFGTRIFYESLKLVESVDIQRNHKNLFQYRPPDKTALIIQGVSDLSIFSESGAELIPNLVPDGGGLVITFAPIRRRSSLKNEQISKEEKTGHGPNYSQLMGVSYDFGDKPGRAVRRSTGSGSILPHVLPWRSSLYFDDLASVWRIIYTKNDSPVLIERDFGRGRIILISDSYFLSNEAMAANRSPGILSWIVGDCETVVFDESHLGVYQSPGIAQLARKYGLHGFIFGLTLLAVLFVWKSASPLIPPPKTDKREKNQHFAAESDNIQGLVNLIRRSVPENDVIKVCLAEWKKTCNPEFDTDMSKRIEHIANAGESGQGRKTDPASRYNAIVRLLSKWKKQ